MESQSPIICYQVVGAYHLKNDKDHCNFFVAREGKVDSVENVNVAGKTDFSEHNPIKGMHIRNFLSYLKKFEIGTAYAILLGSKEKIEILQSVDTYHLSKPDYFFTGTLTMEVLFASKIEKNFVPVIRTMLKQLKTLENIVD